MKSLAYENALIFEKLFLQSIEYGNEEGARMAMDTLHRIFKKLNEEEKKEFLFQANDITVNGLKFYGEKMNPHASVKTKKDEKNWKKSVKITEDKFGVKEKDFKPRQWKYTMGVFKKIKSNPPRNSPRFNKNEKEKIKKLYESNYSVTDIALKMGASIKAVRKVLSEFGIKKYSAKEIKIKKIKFKDEPLYLDDPLYFYENKGLDDKYTLDDLSKLLGMSESELRKKLKNPVCKKFGMSEKDRYFYNLKKHAKVRKGVTNIDSMQKLKRWGSWAVRFYGRKDKPPLIKRGIYTPLACTAPAWGKYPPNNWKEAKIIYTKGKDALAIYKEMKKYVGTKYTFTKEERKWLNKAFLDFTV